MTRDEIYKDIEETFGLVPSFFKKVPDRSLELEWKTFKVVQLGESEIPNKYRELIGLGISAVTKCQYCLYYHTEVAKLFGATDVEIEDAVHYAKGTASWSTYLNGMQMDFGQFKSELDSACHYIKQKQAVPV